MKILIVEDEDVAVRGLTKKLGNSQYVIEVVAILKSIDESVKWLSNNRSDVDLVFMDIQLKDGSCFEIFKQIEVKLPIVFCTSYDKYAIKAFQVNSLNYLLKPITQQDVNKSIEMYQKYKVPEDTQKNICTDLLRMLDKGVEHNDYRSRFLIKIGNKYHYLNVSEISHIYIEYKFVYAITSSGKKSPLDYSIEYLEELLPSNQFFRINRQQIISIGSIESIINDYGRITVKLKPSSKDIVFVSRNRVDAFKKWLDS